MMDFFKKILNLPYWTLLGLLVLSASLSIWALRHNNLQMVKLRSAVFAADKRGSGVEESLDELRAYVYSHMNTSLTSGGNSIRPPIQLKYTYARLLKAEQAKADVVNKEIYTAAQAYCERQDPNSFSGRNRVPCITNYVTKHGAAAKTVPAALYQFDFISPLWSPDLAGWSLLFTLLVFVVFALSLTYDKLMRAHAGRQEL